MSAELSLVPSQSPAETPVAPVSLTRGPLERSIRNLAIRSTLVFAAAMSPILNYDSASAGAGHSPTTQPDNGPKCWEVFGSTSSSDDPIYIKTLGLQRGSTLNGIQESTSGYMNVGHSAESTDTITLDCDTPMPGNQDSADSA